MDDIVRLDGSLCTGPHRPAAHADRALQTEKPVWRDHGRVLAGPTPHQMTQREKTGERTVGQRAERVHKGLHRSNLPRPVTLNLMSD